MLIEMGDITVAAGLPWYRLHGWDRTGSFEGELQSRWAVQHLCLALDVRA